MTSPGRGLLSRLTDLCLRHRRLVVYGWIAVVALGIAGSLRLGPLLTTGFSLPGTDSSKVKQVLVHHYGVRSNAVFVLIAKGDDALARDRLAAAEASRLLPGGTVGRVTRLPSGAAASFVTSRLSGSAAAAEIGALRQTVGPDVFVTGDAAIQHDMGPVLARDLRVGELYFAVPAALVILLLVFGTASALLPFLFAAATIPPALGIAWGAAHVLELSDYLRNMVLMIGLGIAIDYSLLVVNRYRDERRNGRAHDEAVRETMAHAGRTILFSGLAVSVGLALMLLLPVPFLRGFGVGGLVIPIVSVVCALTLLPVLLASLGDRLERIRILPHGLAERRHAGELRLWAAHAGWVMRRAKVLTPLVATLLVLAALPLIGIRVGPGSTSSLPPGIPAMRGLAILQHGSNTDTLDPDDDHRRHRPRGRHEHRRAGREDARPPAPRRPRGRARLARGEGRERPLSPHRRRRPPRPGGPRGAGVRRPPPLQADPRGRLPRLGGRDRRRRRCLRHRLRLAHARIVPLARSSACSRSRTCCSCARSARSCCR